MNERELSAVRAEIVAACACPVCQAPRGWPCTASGRFAEVHAERARAVGVDPARLQEPPEPWSPASARRATRPTLRSATKAAAATRTAKPTSTTPRRPAHEPKAKRSSVSTPRRPAWHLEADAGAPPRPFDVSFAPERTADLTVEFSEDARAELLHYATCRGGYTEEGGCAIAVAPTPRSLIVVAVGGPGPESKRTATSYRSDGAHDLHFVNQARAGLRQVHGKRDRELVEIGWHTHPVPGVDQLSEPDQQSSVRALLDKREFDGAFVTDSHVELIVTPDQARGLDKLHVAAWVTSQAGQAAGRPWFRIERARVKL